VAITDKTAIFSHPKDKNGYLFFNYIVYFSPPHAQLGGRCPSEYAAAVSNLLAGQGHAQQGPGGQTCARGWYTTLFCPSKLNSPMARATNGPLGSTSGHPGRRAWPPSKPRDLGGRYRPSPRPEGPSLGAFGPQPRAPSYSIIQLNN